jgi:hypothetical protein
LGISLAKIAFRWYLRVFIESDYQLLGGLYGAFAHDAGLDTGLTLSADFWVDNNGLSTVATRERTRRAAGKAGCIRALLAHDRHVLHRLIEGKHLDARRARTKPPFVPLATDKFTDAAAYTSLGHNSNPHILDNPF